MKLLIIRHGDPDYAVDSLTEKGWREASYLKERLLCENISAFYSSPHGRARDTAKPTLDALGRKDEVLPWLREFDAYVVDPESGEKRIAWDRLPREVNENPDYLTVCAGLKRLFTARAMCGKSTIPCVMGWTRF